MADLYSDIEPEPGRTYRATSDDPSISIAIPFLRPRYLILFLCRKDIPLDPVLYFDRGGGYTESDCISLEEKVGPNFYVLLLNELRGVKKVRFDPTSVPGRFGFWIKSIYFPLSLARVVKDLSNSVRDSIEGSSNFVFIGAANGTDIQHRMRVAPDIATHYAHVVSLPKREHRLAVPWTTASTPLMSIVVPTYNTPPDFIDFLVASFDAQEPRVAELILSDDGSTSKATTECLERLRGRTNISVLFASTNRGIAAATNLGIQAARGQWIGFLDHDDALAPFALRQIALAVHEHPNAKLFYSDEVVADANMKPQGYILKPSFDPILLQGVNYINHFALYRADLLARIEGLREGFDGSQDYDLLLRYTGGLHGRDVVHVPYPAYLWRRTPTSYSTTFVEASIGNARRALGAHFESQYGIIPIEPAIDVNLHRPRFDAAMQHWPRVSIVIPNRDSFGLISAVLDGLLNHTDYPDFEIIVVDNGSDDLRVLNLYEKLQQDSRFVIDIQREPFNFSRQVNRGIRLSKGDHVLLLNNDIEIVSGGWLREMVSCMRLPDVGIVGAKLLYPDGTIQHAGVIVGLGGLAGHWYEGKPSDFPGPFGRLSVRQSLSAVTGACMLISRNCLQRVGKFDEHLFAVAYNDIDFCLRAASSGFRTVWTPFAALIHHESASRGSDELPANRQRFAREKQMLRTRHHTYNFNDPYFSPWFTRDRSEPGLALHERLPDPRPGL